MKKWFSTILGLASLLVLIPSLHAQKIYTQTRRSSIQAGVGGMYLNNDFSMRKNYGLAVWGDYDFTRLIGAEVEAHFGGIISPDDIGENSYQIGPRFSYHRNKYSLYGKVLFGKATISNQLYKTSSTYNIYSFGGGFEYRIARKFVIRAPDIEIQKWGDFEPHTLSPLSVVVGVSYVIK